jgi:hypothetical protein
MSSPFFIQSVIGNKETSYDATMVIGIDSTTDQNYLKAYNRNYEDDNQLWTFVPVPQIENGFYLQNPATGLVIDIHEKKYEPGTPLDGYPMKNNVDETYYWNNQLWYFVPNPKYEAPWYFIVNGESGLVIDVYQADTATDFAESGTTVDVWNQKTTGPDWDNQVWSFATKDSTFVIPQWSGLSSNEPLGSG